MRCQRRSFVCQHGDAECLYAPLSHSTNFMTFPSKIPVPANLFTMRGPISQFRRLDFELKLLSAVDPTTGDRRAGIDYFHVMKKQENVAVIQLLRQLPGPIDVKLQLDMNIYSKDFDSDGNEVFFGTAVAIINLYVTGSDY